MKLLYQQGGEYEISLNDQLENFYNQCRINRFFDHEVTYFFHTENLTIEIEKNQKKLLRGSSRLKEAVYRFYSGVRATFVFYPRRNHLNEEELQSLCSDIQPIMHTKFSSLIMIY